MTAKTNGAQLHLPFQDRTDDWAERKRQEFAEHLKSEHWLALRDARCLRAKGKCECCGRNDGSELHHLTYVRIFNERIDDVLWVCGPCHRKLGDMKKAWRSTNSRPTAPHPITPEAA